MSQLPVDRAWTFEEIDKFIAARATRTAMRAALTAMLAPRATLERCTIRRVKARPGVYLTVWAEAAVAWRAQRIVRPFSATFPGESAVLAGGREAGAEGPFRRLFDRGECTLTVAPHDPDFPNLARLWAAFGEAISTVRYRPGERHVVRLAVPGEPLRFAKLARPGTGQQAADALGRFAAQVNAAGDLIVGPRSVADDVISYPATSGRSLAVLAPPQLQQWMHRAGQALRQIHEAGANAPAVHSLEQELRVAARVGRRTASMAPTLAERLHTIEARLCSAASITAPSNTVSLHGDMKLDHLHVGHGRLGMIDIDRAGRGEAAIDIGNLGADIRWWARSLPGDAAGAALTSLAAGYGEAAAEDPRVTLMEAIALLRIAGRRPRLGTRRWLDDTTAAVTLAEGALARLDHLLGRSPVR